MLNILFNKYYKDYNLDNVIKDNNDLIMDENDSLISDILELDNNSVIPFPRLSHEYRTKVNGERVRVKSKLVVEDFTLNFHISKRYAKYYYTGKSIYTILYEYFRKNMKYIELDIISGDKPNLDVLDYEYRNIDIHKYIEGYNYVNTYVVYPKNMIEYKDEYSHITFSITFEVLKVRPKNEREVFRIIPSSSSTFIQSVSDNYYDVKLNYFIKADDYSITYDYESSRQIESTFTNQGKYISVNDYKFSILNYKLLATKDYVLLKNYSISSAMEPLNILIDVNEILGVSAKKVMECSSGVRSLSYKEASNLRKLNIYSDTLISTKPGVTCELRIVGGIYL